MPSAEVSIVTYLQAQIESLDKRIDRRLIDQERAVDVALTSVNARLAYLNELRGAMQDQANTYLPRNEYVIMHQTVVDKVDAISRTVAREEANSKGRKEATGTVGSTANTILIALMTTVSVGSMVISLFHKW